MAPKPISIEEKLDRRTNKHTDGCWLWTGAQADGYGILSLGTAIRKVHRLSYVRFHGPIPEALPIICHRCDIRLCLNPDHLFAGTISGNNADKVAKGRMVMPRGVDSATSKLTENDVYEIRAAIGRQKDIGASFGISQAAVYYIKKRLIWAHLAERPTS